MVKILMSGCNGRMGKVISSLAAEDTDVQIAAGIDVAGTSACEYPVYKRFEDVKENADVIVDFSSPKAFDDMLDYAVSKNIPVVVCTTGLAKEQLQRLEKESGRVAVLRSANMSVGINLLLKLLREAAPVLAGEGFDIEIIEEHHNQKKDAPSGTALALADSIKESLDGRYHTVYDRTERSEKRDPAEIGISSVRGGTIPGIHRVLFAGTDEVIEFTHTAYSRTIFGKGAVAAAKFLAGKPAGYYGMEDVIG